ncbi:MAG: hypothetical protein U1D35_09705, partial [Paracoccaceae bacterium]|nr:hypothetical protein [Paracoccaceae bacterium]
LHNLAPPDKPIPAIRHTSLHLLAQTFWQTRHPSETREINGARAALTVHWSFEGLQPVDLTFRLAVAPRHFDGVSDCIDTKVEDLQPRHWNG